MHLCIIPNPSYNKTYLKLLNSVLFLILYRKYTWLDKNVDY